MPNQTSNIKIFRDRFGLSQQDMAVYLQITRSLLSMAEAGSRELPTQALLRLATLESLFQKCLADETTIKGNLLQDKAAADELDTQIQGCRLRAGRLREKLELSRQQYHHLLCWQTILETLRSQPGQQEERDQLWLQNQLIDMPGKLTRCNPVAQARLEAEIEKLLSEAEINERLSKKLGGSR